MISLLNSILRLLDVRLVRNSKYSRLIANADRFRAYELLEFIDDKYLVEFLESRKYSTSQLCQDLFVLSQTQFKFGGFFVEFGATNGMDFSNSLLLEKKFGWRGILAEPARLWHRELFANRSASIETDCVWKESGLSLLFNEVEDEIHSGELSTIDLFSKADKHSNSRKSGKKYEVRTISLLDLLRKHDAPRVIDYLSIDTEGSEFEILSAFDFNEYDIRIITCEHNYTENREKIFDLLTENGYVKKHSEISVFDDWYVRT